MHKTKKKKFDKRRNLMQLRQIKIQKALRWQRERESDYSLAPDVVSDGQLHDCLFDICQIDEIFGRNFAEKHSHSNCFGLVTICCEMVAAETK